MKLNFFLQQCFWAIFLFSMSGCVLLSNSEGIKTLMDYAQEQESLSQSMQCQNDLFDQLLIRLQKGESFEQKTQIWFLREFGPPVLMTENKTPGERAQEVWLYRYGMASQSEHKVYVFFSAESLVEHIVVATGQK